MNILNALLFAKEYKQDGGLKILTAYQKKTNKQTKTKPNQNKTRPSFSIADTEQFQNNFLHNLAISSRDKENLKVCDPQMYSNHLSYESSVKVLIPIVWEKGKTPLPHI